MKTGAILAMYSGQNYNKSQYDNALQSRNQVGSSFKTYVLATAVKQGMNVQTSHPGRRLAAVDPAGLTGRGVREAGEASRPVLATTRS